MYQTGPEVTILHWSGSLDKFLSCYMGKQHAPIDTHSVVIAHSAAKHAITIGDLGHDPQENWKKRMLCD